MARNRVPAKPSPVRTPSPKHWTSPQTHCSPSVREQTRMLFILGRSLFVPCQDYCCKHVSFLERWGEEATDGTCTTNGGSILTNVPLYDKKSNIAYLAAAGPGSNEDRYQDVKQDPYRYTHPEVYQDQLEDLFPHDVFPALIGGARSAVVCGMVGWNGRRGL